MDAQYKISGVIIFLVCLLGSIPVVAKDLSQASYTQGAPAPLTGLQDFQGNTRTLEDFKGKGKWLIVMIWASDCHVCNAEAHQYVDFQTRHSLKDATVLGISIDGAEKKADALEFIKRNNINFPNLIGEPETIASLYTEITESPWIGTPSFLIYSSTGILRAKQAGVVPANLIDDFIQQEMAAAAKNK